MCGDEAASLHFLESKRWASKAVEKGSSPWGWTRLGGNCKLHSAKHLLVFVLLHETVHVKIGQLRL